MPTSLLRSLLCASVSFARFCPNMTFKRPMDVELGADGCLYLLENGTAWNGNKDTQLVRIEYQPD